MAASKSGSREGIRLRVLVRNRGFARSFRGCRCLRSGKRMNAMTHRSHRFSGLSLAAAFAGGAAAGVVASRLAPPVAAMAAGSAWASAGRDPFEGLVADHRRFLALLLEMEQSPDGALFQRTQLLLRLKRGLAAHAMAEEDVLYPLLHDRAKGEQDAKHLYAEHADMKVFLYRLERMPKDSADWARQAATLRELVEKHARHEEEVDFPRLRAALDDAASVRFARDLHRERSLVL